MIKQIDTPLSEAEVKVTHDWLEKNRSEIPEKIYANINLAIKYCEAIDQLKYKIKDMISLLSQHMGLTSKSERGTPQKHWWGAKKSR